VCAYLLLVFRQSIANRIFVVKSGKCDVVHGLSLHDHKKDVDNEIKLLQLELLTMQDPVLREQMESTIQKHRMKKQLIEGGHGKGSRRFTVQHNQEESYDYRRNYAFRSTMALKMRRCCWNRNDKGKIIDFEQNQRRIHDKATPKLPQQRKATKTTSSNTSMSLAELVPRDAFGFESVFEITKTKEEHPMTGSATNAINRVSLVAKTAVEILFIPKRDFFIFTTFETRQLMRKKLMNPKLAHLGYFSRIFKDPTEAIEKQKIWNAYKASVTKQFVSRHAKHALFNM
jgi:hypothetical protein